MMVLVEVALGEETGFDNEDIPEPSSPQSVMEENGDDVGDHLNPIDGFVGLELFGMTARMNWNTILLATVT